MMKNQMDNYEILLDTMKNRFTVAGESGDCTLGEYMLLKANEKKEVKALTVAETTAVVKKENSALPAMISYVNNKLIITAPPVKDKTIKSFPVRTSASAFLSAAVACAFIFSFGIIGVKVLGLSNNISGEASAVEYSEELVEESVNETAEVIFE